MLGGLASICAGTATHPIELIKIRFQMQNQAQIKYRNFPHAFASILSNEGLTGLYKGITALWFKESIYSTLRLGTYEPLRNYFSNGVSPAETPLIVKFYTGGLAGLIGSTFSAPADIVKVRMQACDHQKP